MYVTVMNINRKEAMKVTTTHLNEARDYYNLCDKARTLGIPTSLDDPRSPKTVQALSDAVTNAR